jgi:hypothetical protein
MTTKVVFVELTVVPRALPLVSGYMEAMCRADPDLASACRFEKISLPVKTPAADILRTLEDADGDVYALSTYVWNSGLVKRLAETVRTAKPGADVILGGPQVMHHCVDYVARDAANMFVCNGEGEITFPSFLKTTRTAERDFSSVRGLSFYRDGELVTTEPQPRIGDLSTIPSPFLQGLFGAQDYTWMLVETNRGCPFRCAYCFWGGSSGAMVSQFDVARLEGELEWISRSSCLYLFIADANFGMLKRDAELARYLVGASERNGAPLSVFFCASKNTPARVEEIGRTFHNAGLLSCQSVALQSLNADALSRANRQNIRTSSYIDLQQSLNRRGSASYVELIWPLPGETLQSFRQGLSDLCAMEADSFMVYPLLLINNVELSSRRDEYQLRTVRNTDEDSEAEIVVQTAEVDRESYDEGMLYAYAVNALYGMRGLRSLAKYLHASGTLSYGDLFSAFVAFAGARPDNPWTALCRRSVRNLEHGTFATQGEQVHLVLQGERDAFDSLLKEFVTSQPFWQDATAQFTFEIDLVSRPYVYRNTPIVPKRYRFRQFSSVETTEDGYVVSMSPAHRALLPSYVAVSGSQSCGLIVRHRHRSQLPLMPTKSAHDTFMYCQNMWHHMRDLTPVWQALDTPLTSSLDRATASRPPREPIIRRL